MRVAPDNFVLPAKIKLSSVKQPKLQVGNNYVALYDGIALADGSFDKKYIESILYIVYRNFVIAILSTKIQLIFSIQLLY